MGKFPLSHEQIKKTITESNLVLLFQFLLMQDGKFVGFERHVLKKWQDKIKIDDTDTTARVAHDKEKGKRKSHYEYVDKKQLYILHRSPEGLFFGKELYGEKTLLTDEDVINVWHSNFSWEQIFRGIKHDNKILVTESNINSIVNNVYKIMSGWRWEIVGNHYSAGEGMRQFTVACVGRTQAYEKKTSYGIDIKTLDEWGKVNGITREQD